MNSSSVRLTSDSFVKPRHTMEDSEKPIYLPPCDLAMLSVHYIQKGLLFVKPQEAFDNHPPGQFMASFLKNLKFSLSLALVHFYPLAGRLRTLKSDGPHFYTIFVDCGSNSPGTRFIYATLDATISDILSPTYVPVVTKSFFDHDRAVSHDGHTISLLSVQVTELVDGIFIGCSMNHCIGDGSSFWHFLNTWSEIHQSGGGYCSTISRPPVLQRWFPDSCKVPINLPFNDPSEFVSRHESPVLLEKFFHFSSESIARLKVKANDECDTNTISSFQALTALVWKSITRARRFSSYKIITSCRMSANDRSRMSPPLSPYYFGNSISAVRASTEVGELLRHGLGWAAWKLHQAIADHTDDEVSQWHKEWMERPLVYDIARTFDLNSIMMGSSPRFNKYGPQFGLGKAVAVRSGYANKFDGKVSGYPGKEGGGSVDLEVCLLPERMAALESDEEFMAAVTV